MQSKSLILFICAACMLLVSCDSQPAVPGGAMPAVPVLASKPTLKDITVNIETIGTLQSEVVMEIKPQVSGTLREVLVGEGQWVQKGTPLFRVDDTLYGIKVKEAVAQLTMDVASYQATLKKLARYKDLAQKDLLAQTEWDDLEATAEKSQATIDLDEARLEAAKLDLEHCTIYAPLSGRVGKLEAHAGQLVASGQSTPLATIAKLDPLVVEFSVTEKEFPKVPQLAGRIQVKPLCADCVEKGGSIDFLDNHFDVKTGLILVKGRISNAEYALRPGQTMRVHIPVAVQTNVKLIPQKAVRYNQQGPYVYVVQPDQTVALRQLILGDEQGNDIVVLEGLDLTEPVITDGHLRLAPGLKVDIKS